MKTVTWVNGGVCDHVAVSDRGFLFGDACFTTMAKFNGALERFEEHLGRLQRDAQRLLFPSVDWTLLEKEIRAFAAIHSNGIIRISLTRGSGGSGYIMPDYPHITRVLQWREFSPLLQQNAKLGIAVFDCQTRLAQQPLLAGVKHSSRIENILARAEWRDGGYSEGLLCDQQDIVVECTSSNIFWREQDGWYTPALTHCGVAGVMRAEILSLMRTHGIRVQEVHRSKLQVLSAMQESFVCNSVIGIWPVTQIVRKILNIGQDTRHFQAAIGRAG